MRVVLVFLLSIFALQLRAQSLPKIVFDSTTVNLGRVSQDETVIHIFGFQNIGGDSLIIEKVSSG